MPRPKTILPVEHERITAELLGSYLERQGFAYRRASDGERFRETRDPGTRSNVAGRGAATLLPKKVGRIPDLGPVLRIESGCHRPELKAARSLLI